MIFYGIVHVILIACVIYLIVEGIRIARSIKRLHELSEQIQEVLGEVEHGTPDG